MSSKKTIIVVGGGAGGAYVSVALSKSLPPNFELILINPRPYRICLPASLRLVVSDTNNLDNPETGALIPYDKIFSGNPNARFVHASVTAVLPSEGNSKGKVILNTNEQLAYDALILATGSKWGGAIDFPEGDEKVLLDYINARREEFKNAKEILIVGGGPAGIELAGEIKDIWPSKPITILQRGSKLLSSVYPDGFRNRIAKQLKARGVNLIFEDALDIDSEARIATVGELQTFKTKGGRELKADLVVCLDPISFFPFLF
jgi:apoptosis-inducing factor 2